MECRVWIDLSETYHEYIDTKCDDHSFPQVTLVIWYHIAKPRRYLPM